MKFTLEWLKSHLDTNASLDEISKTLTMIGLEVESITDKSEELKAFTVAKVLHAEKHPEADKLRICKVLSDVGELQIVCGAPNARAGIFVVLAKEGVLIPRDQFKIKKTKIRGVESNGMLCSADELGIGGDSAGIIELPEAPIGASVVDVLGLNDPVIEIAITPNRADCLGVRGVARDLAAAGLGRLKPLPEIVGVEGSFKSPVSVSISTPNCHQFIGCYIKNVKNGPSPAWMKKRLEAIGQKSISALVDITNYMTIDMGRPLHVYDAKKLKGNLNVRGAKEGEKLKALNNNEYTLKADMCVIADDSGPVALGGVIGGEPTGCTETTTDVFLEVALFNPTHVAATGRALQIDSDARYRFERGVDVAFVKTGAELALLLIREICGGDVSELVNAGKAPEWERSIAFNPARIQSLGGVNVDKTKAETILKSLGFEPSGSAFQPPSWRADVEGEADLVEEVLRINGYDNIPATPLPKLSSISKPSLDTAQKRAHLARRVLASRGMLECCTWSFLSDARAAQFGGNNPKLKLINPIAADLSVMRPSPLPNLLDAAKKNNFRGFKNLALFEAGLQFSDITPEGQRMVVAGIRTGESANYNGFVRKVKGSLPDFSTEAFKREDGVFNINVYPIFALAAKTDALAVLQALGVTKCDATAEAPAWYHPGRSGALKQGKNVLGYFGEIHPGLLPSFDLDGPVIAFEIFLDAIPVPRAKGKARAALRLSDYQAVERDFAFTVDAKITAGDIIKFIASADKTLITDVAIFDVYAGKGVEPGKKSVAIKVTLQSMDRTLSEQDITTASQAIVSAAAKGFGGVLRQ